MSSDLSNPIQDQTLETRAFHYILERIVSGKYPPGKKLVQREVAEEINMSRIPVSKAITVLQEKGFLDYDIRRIAVVRAFNERDIENEIILREAVEVEAVRRFATYHTERQITELYWKAEDIDSMLQNVDEENTIIGLAEKHLQFHQMIPQAIGIDLLANVLDRPSMHLIFGQSEMSTLRKKDTPPDWHTRLVDAMRSKDPQTAEEAMRKHIRFIFD